MRLFDMRSGFESRVSVPIQLVHLVPDLKNVLIICQKCFEHFKSGTRIAGTAYTSLRQNFRRDFKFSALKINKK